MARQSRTKAKYIVANPNGIPEGVRIISWGEHEWYEGDDFDPPKGLKLDRLLKDGYIVEQADG